MSEDVNRSPKDTLEMMSLKHCRELGSDRKLKVGKSYLHFRTASPRALWI